MSNLIEVYREWQSNPKFRETFKKNPELALQEAGLIISAEDLAKIRSVLLLKNGKSDNEELDDRISK